MKKTVLFSSLTIAVIILLSSCTINKKNDSSTTNTPSIIGTWKLISGMIIEGDDTVFTDYTKNQEMIKIINKSHFAFLKHDLKNGKDSNANFESGGGKYYLKEGKYIEHLEYCNTREWENNTFEFEYSINGDTLTTKGIEEITELDINQIIIEKYVRATK